MHGKLAVLASRGQVSKALELARQLGAPTVDERVTLCELEALSANRDEAMRLATSVLATTAPIGAIVRALLVAGRLDFYCGNTTEGQQRFARARDLAMQQPDPAVSAIAIGAHIEALLRYVSYEAAIGHLSQYRRAAIRAGTALSLSTLHRVLAESELKSGRGQRALKELRLARTHISAVDSLCNEAELELTHSATHGLLGDVNTAHAHALRAEELARRSGAHRLVRNALTNAAHFQVLLGHHARAAATIASIRGHARGLDADLNIRATELMLATALRDGHAAHRIDAEFGPIATSRHSVSTQWYKLAQASHLIATGRAAEAAATAAKCIADSGGGIDHSYVDRVLVVAAEALMLTGRFEEACNAIASVALGHQGTLTEFVASVQRISGRLSIDCPDAAFDHFSRAARVYGHTGHIVGRGESLHNAASLRASLEPHGRILAVPHVTDFYTEPKADYGRVDCAAAISAPAQSVAQAIRAAAALIDLSSRPALASFELLSLIASSDAAESAVMVASTGSAPAIRGWTGTEQPDRSLVRPGQSTVTFVLGNEDGRDIAVTARPRNHGSARSTLLALQRLVLHGSSLHSAALAESERSAHWPEPLPEQQLGLVCHSESMLQLLSAARRVATSNFAVLITGETGTGKELLARAIHFASHRREQRFQPFNCSAVSRDMLDSQLFGYRRGAFTGAQDSFPGVIRNAIGGTLMLDEIGEISLDIQPKLLRFLESNEVHPLGEPSPINVDVRVVAATNANLEKLVEEGRFREDLFYRLNVVQLTIPPLRDRREEIPLLLEHFLDRTQRECGKSGMRIGDTTAEYLLLYNWPGNVRELANEVRRAVAMAESGAVLMPEHLSSRVTSSRRTVPASQRPADDAELVVRRDQPLTAAVEHVERALIQDALRVHPNVEDAARALGLSRKGLYLKRQRLKLDE